MSATQQKNADYFQQMKEKEDEEAKARLAEELAGMTPEQLAAREAEDAAKREADNKKSNHLTRLGGTFAHKGASLLGGRGLARGPRGPPRG